MIARKSIVTILITMEKSLVKWAPGLGATLDLIGSELLCNVITLTGK